MFTITKLESGMLEGSMSKCCLSLHHIFSFTFNIVESLQASTPPSGWVHLWATALSFLLYAQKLLRL